MKKENARSENLSQFGKIITFYEFLFFYFEEFCCLNVLFILFYFILHSVCDLINEFVCCKLQRTYLVVAES